MKRLVKILIGAAFLTLVGLALFVVRPAREPENRIDLAPSGPGSWAFHEESTLRNVTRTPVAYTVNPGSPEARRRTLAVGAVDRIVSDVPVEIAYDNGRRTASYFVHPGRPYSFRYDEENIVRVYPGSHGRENEADLAPYVPTPPEVVARMIELAAIGPKDVVYDLGCGDGRMVIAAAKTRGCRGVGLELDEALLKQCRENAVREGVDGLVRFVRQDATTARLGAATVLLLYLLPESLETLAPVFERDLRPGARVVSHDYKIPGWDPRLVTTEVLPGGAERDHRVLLYKMTERR